MIEKTMRVFGLLSMTMLLILIMIPTTASAPLPQAVISTPTPQADGRIIYIVKENDTCISIALLMGISEQELRELNDLEPDDCQFLWVKKFPLRNHKIEYHKLKVNELPSVLYHGTISSRLSSILKEGIKPMKRKYVHLSLTIEDALIVGLRRKKKGDKVVILEVDPASLIEKGYDIFKASETVFLVKKVPPDCIRNIREMQL